MKQLINRGITSTYIKIGENTFISQVKVWIFWQVRMIVPFLPYSTVCPSWDSIDSFLKYVNSYFFKSFLFIIKHINTLDTEIKQNIVTMHLSNNLFGFFFVILKISELLRFLPSTNYIHERFKITFSTSCHIQITEYN